MIGLCAICTHDAEGRRMWLGDLRVFVCDRCDAEHPRSGGYDASAVGRPSMHATPTGRELGTVRKGFDLLTDPADASATLRKLGES